MDLIYEKVAFRHALFDQRLRRIGDTDAWQSRKCKVIAGSDEAAARRYPWVILPVEWISQYRAG